MKFKLFGVRFKQKNAYHLLLESNFMLLLFLFSNTKSIINTCIEHRETWSLDRFNHVVVQTFVVISIESMFTYVMNKC